MYPMPEEIVLTDDKILDEIKKFTQGKSEYIPNHLDFVANLYISNLKLEVCVDLPSLYPSEEPDIYVRCNQLNRHQEKILNSELSNYIKNNGIGDVCLYTAISWLQDNADGFIDESFKNNSPVQNYEETSKMDEKFTRMWIYSHHIYNKKKREEIMKLAKELHLTGFCLPGKPGIICIEGTSSDCKEWWKDIKSMTWEKIVLRKTEMFEISQKAMVQKFKKFEELNFHKSFTRNDKHSDLSGFSKYMDEHGLSREFNEFFGFDAYQEP